MTESEIHLFILWETARNKQTQILEDIKSKFEILQVFEIIWSPDLVSNNFTRFYGVNLPSHSIKEKECGSGPFLLVIVKVISVDYDGAWTSHGWEYVERNMFEAKQLYRSWTGGGHKVHGTTNVLETNSNLSLLLGLHTEDFLQQYLGYWNGQIIKKTKDIEGASGWTSLSHLFYVLNGTIPYVILRGEKEILSDLFSADHRDVDILMETKDYQNAKYIINGTSCCNPERPHELIVIDGKDYFIDIWLREKNYFDRSWSSEMLSSRSLQDGLFVLSKQNKLYSLLYHCFFIKGKFAEDYLHDITCLCTEFYDKESCWDRLLFRFLEKNDYIVLRPLDKSVVLHMENPILSEYACKYGVCVNSTVSSCVDEKSGNSLSWLSRVYEKENSFIKQGSHFLIEREKTALEKLSAYSQFPKIISYWKEENLSYLEISKMDGLDVTSFFTQKRTATPSNIKSFTKQVLQILEILYTEGIMHRDLIAQNLLVKSTAVGCIVSCIDFGWSIDYQSNDDYPCPVGLAGKQHCEPRYSDFANLASVVGSVLMMPYTKRIQKELFKVTFDNYLDADFCRAVLSSAKTKANKSMNLLDYYAILRKRYTRVDLFVRAIKAKMPDWLWDRIKL